jgi:hypothetical protein
MAKADGGLCLGVNDGLVAEPPRPAICSVCRTERRVQTKREFRGGDAKQNRTGRQLVFSLGFMSQLSPQARDTIDSEIQRIVDAQFRRAQQLLVEHRTALDGLMTDLLKAETVDGSVVKAGARAQPGRRIGRTGSI